MLCLISSLFVSISSDLSRPAVGLESYTEMKEHSAYTELLGSFRSERRSIACLVTGYFVRSSYLIGRGS